MSILLQLSSENLSSRVYGRIRSALMDGEFAPGERLRIKDLSSQLGTSITPVREAIFKLVSERALEMRAATAIHVPILGPDDLRQIQLMRLALEGAAAERACTLMTPADLDRLAKIQEEFVIAAAKDAALAAKLNTDFHFGLLRAAQMPLVTATVENFWVMMGPLLRTFHNEMPRREISSRNHKHYQVLRALRKRDPQAARAAIQDDIRWSDVIIAWLEKQNAA
ncbi:HTH-type transcriptional regulator McbR [compost metagenome]